MSNRKIREIEKKIGKIKSALQKIGEMRPGSLTRQYRVPKEKIGPYYHLSYMHKMQSRTDYVRPAFVDRIKQQVSTYKSFKILINKWIELAIAHSKCTINIAKKKNL